MKAVRLNEWAQPVQIEDQPEPSPASDEVLVRIHATAVNPMERIIVLGYAQSMFSLPMTLGRDFSGEVVAVGSDVQHVKPGDLVFGMSPVQATYAQFAAVKQQGVAHKPATLDDAEAASVPVVGLTAWQTVFDLAKLQSGDRVLIHGAGGGVGSFAVQLAKDAGAYVIGHDKGDKADFVKQLGADEFIDSDTQRFEDVVGTVDVVLDYVGGEMPDRSFNILGDGGRFVTSAAQLGEDAGKDRGITATGTYTQPSIDQLTKLAEAIDSGKVKVFVNRTFPLEETQTALFYQPEGNAPGKVVITIS
jgi:NADPH:quinone reductase-like Zn-dependent oxidoreductase